MNIGFLSRIRSRIMLLSLLPTTILVVLVTQYFAMSRINDLELSFTQRGNAIAQNLAASSVYGLFTGNTERLRLASEELLKRSDALSITITDNDGGVVLELPEGGLTSLQVSNPDLASYFAPVHAPALQDSVQDFPEAPSALGGLEDPPEARQIGTVTVHLYQKEFSDRQRVIIGQAVLVTLLGLGVTSLLALGFSRKLTLPLEDLSAAARNISNGNFSVHVPEVSSGELGLLEKGFNTMVQEVASAHGKLEQRVEIATSELLETMDHLEIKNIQLELSRKQEREANLAQQLFLTSVSHEIRTPLNAVVNFLRLLRDTPLNARQEEYAMLSEDSARSLLHIINDLLSFSRLQRGDLVLEQGEFDIRTLLGNTLSLLAPDAHRKGLELVLLVYDDVPTILRGDGQRIQQIVTNLVSNAIKFTAQGQVAVRVQLDDRLNDQCTLLIQVADTGIGVPAQQAEEIFEPFKQIRSSDHNTFGGTGLGLSISRRYARAMGGDLWLVPSDEPGAVFELKTTLQVPSSEIVAAIDKGLGEVEIHLFDTHPLSGLATLHCLRHSRANVLRHETFDALLAACGHADGPPSIALLGLDHDTIASKRYEDWLKPLRETGIPIMVLASSSDSATLDALVKAGAQQCRSKPLAASTLSQALHSVVLQQYPGLSGGEPANASGAKSEALPDFSGFRVLVADDNQINRRLMMALLERVKVDMRGAANGQEVLDMLADTPADLVILDVHMPVLNGLETARRLRQDPALRDIPVVALTADGMPESLQRIADAGMNDGLIKPIDEPSLWTIIRKAQAGEYRPLLPVEPQAMAPSAHTDISMNPSDLLARDAKRALRIAGNSETLTYEIFQSFCNGLPEQLAQLKTHFTESNWVELRELAHQVRGSSQFCALPALDASLEQLEHAVDRGDGESADICLEAMESEVARVLQEFDAMVDPSGKARHAAKNLRTSSEI